VDWITNPKLLTKQGVSVEFAGGSSVDEYVVPSVTFRLPLERGAETRAAEGVGDPQPLPAGRAVPGTIA
jgi:hypothetical protein